MVIQWDFYRVSNSFVALQQQQRQLRHTQNTTSDNDDDLLTSLVELNHWVVEQQQRPPAHRSLSKRQDGNEKVVYLAHPPVLIPSIGHDNNDTTNDNYRKSENDLPVVSSSSSMAPWEEEELEAMMEELDVMEVVDEAATTATNVNDNFEQQPSPSPSSTAIAISKGTKTTTANNNNNNNNNDGGNCDYYTEWTFSILFHETYRVPTLYFTCHDVSNGLPLSRREVLHILLARQQYEHASKRQGPGNEGRDSCCDDDRYHHGESSEEDERRWREGEEELLWEFVSQEEHPMTGMPSYFLHPCRTAERMELIMMTSSSLSLPSHSGEKDVDDVECRVEVDGHDRRECCPLLSWMSMILPVVGCKISSEVFCRMRKDIE